MLIVLRPLRLVLPKPLLLKGPCILLPTQMAIRTLNAVNRGDIK